MNILVGPNNSGKSTILAAFRILAAGLRRASARRPVRVTGPNGDTFGYQIDLTPLSIGEENLFHEYDDSKPAMVTFSLSGGKELILFFREEQSCVLIANDPKRRIESPAVFRSAFNCPIGFVPILGPVEHKERLYEMKAARLALYNYRASRNFRNIWHHYPEDFEEFRRILQETWPGMDIEQPEIDISHEHTVLHMFCPEERIPREIFWAGFGFQVWCQMLTHLVKSRDSSIFLIDEPDIYLHSDLQRQLLSLLSNLGPDILIATHSTEIVSEAESDDIVLVDKSRKRGTRINDPSQLAQVFSSLGSNLNPILTQLAKTRRVIFVEGKDFQVFSKFARKIGLQNLSSRATFGVVPIDGFNPDRARTLKKGIEAAVGRDVRAAVVLDRDFRSEQECEDIRKRCKDFCDVIAIHLCKEVESFLLVPSAIDRAANRRLAERNRRAGTQIVYVDTATRVLEDFIAEQRSYLVAQFASVRRSFVKRSVPVEAEATTYQNANDDFELDWNQGFIRRVQMVPAKDALSMINRKLEENFGVSVTPAAIIEAMHISEIPGELSELLNRLAKFAVAPT